jgi:CPA2 family monovalent cation:H+ antiporter-2
MRGERRINIPGGEERIFPFDKLVVVGNDDDLLHFRDYIDMQYKSLPAIQPTAEVNIEQFLIVKGSNLIGRTIRESGIRDKAACLVIGIERDNTSIKNPVPSTVFEEGDVVWIVGEHDKVLLLSEGNIVQ